MELTNKNTYNIHLFFRFLKNYHTYNQYLYEARKRFQKRSILYGKHYDDFELWLCDMINGQSGNVIDSSLTWMDTEQGHHFWSVLHMQYQNYYHNNNIDKQQKRYLLTITD